MSMLDDWAAAVCADLGLDEGTADVRAILDLARDVAHAVDRPAAPLTAYLAGVAVGRGLDPASAAARIRAVVSGWQPTGRENETTNGLSGELRV
jgi:Domain of unknown function (DUF6457)